MIMTSPETTIMDFKSLSLFREMAETAHNGIVLTDLSGRILVFNQAAGSIANKNPDIILNENMKDMFPDYFKDIQNTANTKTPGIAIKTKLGINEVISNCTPVVIKGDCIGVLSIFQDITEYERLLKELEAYKNLTSELDVIINSSYDGLWICNHEGRVVRVNRASEKMSGVKEEEVMGKPMQELLDQGLFDKSATLEVLKNRTAVTLIQRLKDGRHILVTGNPVTDDKGSIRLVVVNARDISELNRLHAELEESRELTQTYRRKLSEINRHRNLTTCIIIRSPQMQKIFETAMRVSGVNSSVLITGESGVGKGLFADLIHQASPRHDASLIHINCGAIPESLIEAELFGYEKGAFTGALEKGKPGYFEIAEGGTLFLDEVGELPLNVQVKLLRFLENNEVVRVGATRARKIDVRIIAATNRDLDHMVAMNKFRKDLFFRLNVVPLNIPPLRERAEDIPPLIHFFMNHFNEKCKTAKILSTEAIDMLTGYSFPGNVRELANIIERLIVLSHGDIIGLTHLPRTLRDNAYECGETISENGWNLKDVVMGVEKNFILRALNVAGSLREAAKLLGIDHSTLSRKIKKYGLASGAILHHGD